MIDFTQLHEGYLARGEGSELAATIGIHPTNVSAILAGDYEPNYRVALALAVAFDTTLDKLAHRRPKPFKFTGPEHPILFAAAKRNMSSAELIRRAEISKAQLWAVTRGRKTAGIEWLARVAAALNVSLDGLVQAMRCWED